MYDIGFEPPLDPPDTKYPECPCCGADCEYFFLNINEEVIACNSCWTEDTDFDSVKDARTWEIVTWK